jgi:uncharacterized protein YndB with AHSA1/START domain
MNEPRFVPKTVYVIYIAGTPEKVWEALASAEFTRQYFFGRTVELEPQIGGNFVLRLPDGRLDIKGRVTAWDPPRRLSVTWAVDFEEFRELPESLVTYDIEPMGESVKLTVTEAFQWDVPGRDPRRRSPGLAVHPFRASKACSRPADLSRSALKWGRRRGLLEAIKEAVAKKPWRAAG